MKRSRFSKITTVLTAVAITLCALTVPHVTFAKESLSPAIDTLAQNTVFIKNGMKNSSLKFTPDDFEDALGGARLSSITVLVLPNESDGRLMLGSVPVLANQIITRSKLSKLSFIPTSAEVKEASFVFGCISSGYPRVVSCSLRFTDTLNFAPDTAKSSLSAYSGVQVSSFLPAIDPDGDALTFKVVSRPSSGTVILKDSSSGEFIYTPDENSVGTDSFSYTASDCYGNVSPETTVTVNVKRAPDVNYVDVSPEFEHTALLLADKGVFIGRTLGKYSYFECDLPVSYGEFIIMAMSASGVSLPESDNDILSLLESITDTPASVPEEMSCSAALGIASEICGDTIEIPSLPSGRLTRESAAMIIAEILK